MAITEKVQFCSEKVSNNYFVVDIGKAGLIGFWIESIKIVGFSTRILKAFRFPRKFWKYFRKSVSLPKFLPKILTIKNLKKIDKLTYQAVTASTHLFGPHLLPLQGNAEIKDYAEISLLCLLSLKVLLWNVHNPLCSFNGQHWFLQIR